MSNVQISAGGDEDGSPPLARTVSETAGAEAVEARPLLAPDVATDAEVSTNVSCWGRPRRWWGRLRQLFGTNFLGSIALVYLLQGSRVGFTYLATDYYYKDPVDGLGLSPAEAQALIAVSGLPWAIKPLYGVLCDAVPLFGTHRKGYLGVMGLLGTLGYALLALLPPTRFGCTAALFLCSLGSAFCDVVVDAMVAQGAKRESATAAGNLQSLAWSSYAIGNIFGALSGGVLYTIIGARAILGLFGALYAVTIILAFKLKEPPARPLSYEKMRGQARLLAETLRTAMVSKVVLYIFVMYAALPSVASGTFYFWTDQDACDCPDRDRVHWTTVLPQASDSSWADGTTVGCEWFAARQQQLHGGSPGMACTTPLPILSDSSLYNTSSFHTAAAAAVTTKSPTSLSTSKAILEKAWQVCPQACNECSVNGRGCVGFSAQFLSSIKVVSYLAYLGGVVLYNSRYKTTPFRTIFCWAWVAHGLSIIPDLLLVLRLNTALGLPDELFFLGDHALYTAINQLKHMPFLVLAARICPATIEATFFALLMRSEPPQCHCCCSVWLRVT